MTVPPNLVIPAGKADLIVPLTAAKDAGTAGGVVTDRRDGDGRREGR